MRIDRAADSTAIVLTEKGSNSDPPPRTISFNLATIDSVLKEGSGLPIRTVAEIAGITALLYLLIASQINLSGLN